MKKLLLLLWLPLAAFSSTMYMLPQTNTDVTSAVSNYNAESSWYSFWLDNVAAKTNSLTPVAQNAATLPAVIPTTVSTLSNGTMAAYDPPAAVADNPEPGTWGLLLLGTALGFVALRRRKTKAIMGQ